MLDMGSSEVQFAKQAMREGKALPDRIQNAPELLPGLYLYIQAFYDLDSERSHDFGFRKIPFTSIMNYAKAFEFDEEQTEDLIYLIKHMDSAYIERLEKKKPKKSPKVKGK